MVSGIDSGNDLYLEAQDRMSLLPNYYRWIFSSFSKYVSGAVLELGCGAGNLITYYLRNVEHVYAVDHNLQLLEHVAQHCGKDKISLIEADLREDWETLSEIKVHTVIALDVIEHFEDDQQFVEKAANLLLPGGHLIVKIPAQSQLYGDTDRASGHYRRYDPEHITAIMEQARLDEVFLHSFNSLGALSYRKKRNRDKNFSRTFHPILLKIINHFIPVIAVVDRLIPCKGLSLIGTYRKPC